MGDDGKRHQKIIDLVIATKWLRDRCILCDIAANFDHYSNYSSIIFY